MKEKEDSHHHPLFVFLAHSVCFPKFLAFHVKIDLEQFFLCLKTNALYSPLGFVDKTL